LHGIVRVDLAACRVRHGRAAARFATRPLSSSAPGLCCRQGQPELPRWSRLDSAHVPFSARGASSCGARSREWARRSRGRAT
jgi:hypothetical protein